MPTLEKLGVKNLRSLRSVDPLRIAPITILLGRNSVGKSTFARILPLLRQSSEKKKRSPIIWFGDLVDFGSLSRAMSLGAEELTFTFEITAELQTRRDVVGLLRAAQSRRGIPCRVSITLVEDANGTGFAKRVSIELLGAKIEIDLSSSDNVTALVSVNGQQLTLPTGKWLFAFQGDILPLLYFYEQKKAENGQLSWSSIPNPWEDGPTQRVKSAVHANTSTSTCRRIARQIPLGSVEDISTALESIAGPPGWQNVVRSKAARDLVARQLLESVVTSSLSEIIQQIDTALSTYFQGVRYLKPLRATAERYYRRLDLSISEIESDGSNLAMFLDSLQRDELSKFSNWTSRHMRFEVSARREGDQVMVVAKGVNDPDWFNIADMGFGISQVLPIAAQLWDSTRRPERAALSSAVVLEQPELHLHPDSQARLADIFAGTIRPFGDLSSQPRTSLMVETHSQHLVNRLGQLVEQRKLSPTDVSVILFESSDSLPPCTTVRVSTFSEKGVLTDWPYGFFEPEID